MNNQPVAYQSHFAPAAARQNVLEATVHRFRSVLEAQVQLDDIFLHPQARFKLPQVTDLQLLLPIVGGVQIQRGNDLLTELQSGQFYVLPADVEGISLVNPFPEDKVNVLLIRLPQSASRYAALQGQILSVPITSKNQLIGAEGAPDLLRIGVYDSRQEGLVYPTEPATIVYVINGSFEVDGRLMEFRDALLLRDLPEFDFEALSEMAILLVIQP